MKTGYIVAYDISCSKTRNRVFEALKDFGMRHVQESVFWGVLRSAEVRAVERLLVDACEGLDDRAMFVPMTLADLEKSCLVNYPTGTFRVEEFQVC